MGTWTPEHVSADFLAGQPSYLCAKSSADGSTRTHTSPYSVLVVASIPDGLMAWPLPLICAQPTLAAPTLAPCLAQSHVPWATGSVCSDPLAASPPGHCPCTQGVLGQHPHMIAIKCQAKASCCSTSHPEYPMEMLSPVLSSMEGNSPSLCGPVFSSYGTAAG